MATTKQTTTRRAPRKQDQSIAARTGRTIKREPYTSAAIATGAVTAVVAAIAGAYFFRRSDKSLAEIGDDLSGKIKTGIADARDLAEQGARTFKEKAGFLLADEDEVSTEQSRIAEEALTLKETGRQPQRPLDPTIESELKAGAISY